MLKISVKDTESLRVMIVEGKLVAPWTEELKAVLRAMESGPKKREYIVDVSGITAIAPEGEEVLLSLIAQGAKFRSKGMYMRQVLRELKQRLR